MAPEVYVGLSMSQQKTYRYALFKSSSDRMPHITNIVFNHFDIPVTMAQTKNQEARIVKPRYIAMYLIRKHLKTPFKGIGEYFGGRDHSTVHHACETVNGYLETNKGYREVVTTIENMI